MPNRSLHKKLCTYLCRESLWGLHGLFTYTLAVAEMHSYEIALVAVYIWIDGKPHSCGLQCRDWRGSALSALDFAETRSRGDAKLLSSAQGRKKGERMSDDEAKALRRKVGGTASECSSPSHLHPSPPCQSCPSYWSCAARSLEGCTPSVQQSCKSSRCSEIVNLPIPPQIA